MKKERKPLKIRVIQEFELPPEYGKKHYKEGVQFLWDTVVNYARCQHIIDQMHWMCDETSPNKDFHVKAHKFSSEMIEKSMNTTKYEIV